MSFATSYSKCGVCVFAFQRLVRCWQLEIYTLKQWTFITEKVYTGFSLPLLRKAGSNQNVKMGELVFKGDINLPVWNLT